MRYKNHFFFGMEKSTWLLTILLAITVFLMVNTITSCKKEDYGTQMPKGIIKDTGKLSDTTFHQNSEIK